jgi:hypothetical protein
MNQSNDKRERAQWRVIDTRVKENAAVQVSELPLKVPRYSFRAGTAQFDKDTNEVRIGSRLTVFNVLEAADLLREVGEKYVQLREDKIEEYEDAKRRWQQENTPDDTED